MIIIAQALDRITQKKQKLNNIPMPAVLQNNLDDWFDIEFTYTSNAIEGNTLSMIETAIFVEKGITIGGKTIREHLEVINHAKAINFIRGLAHRKQSGLVFDDICNPIFAITPIGYKAGGKEPKLGPRADEKIIQLIEWLQTASEHPVITAAIAHYKLLDIIIDDSGVPAGVLTKEGRTARLLMNLLLLQHGYPLAIIKKEKRPEYMAAIACPSKLVERSREHARKTEDMTAFYEVIIEAVEYTLDAYLQAVEESGLQ